MKLRSVTAAILCTLALTGCATVLGGKKQQISVNSNVQGAEVLLDGKSLGTTPLVAMLDRGQKGTLTIKKDGYTPYTISLSRKVTPLFWLNILSGASTIGSSIDSSTGAMYEYAPDTYMASLQEAGASADQVETWRRAEGLRAFVLLNSDALIADMADGKGEYVDTLVRLAEVQPSDRAEALARWQSAYAVSATAADFATIVVGERNLVGELD